MTSTPTAPRRQARLRAASLYGGVATALVLLLGACGQTGPLYQPAPPPPVAENTPAASASADDGAGTAVEQTASERAPAEAPTGTDPEGNTPQ